MAARPGYRKRTSTAPRNRVDRPAPRPPERDGSHVPAGDETETGRSAPKKRRSNKGRAVPIVRWKAPLCPGCQEPARVVRTCSPIRYHVCKNPDCEVQGFKSDQVNFDPEVYQRFRERDLN